MRNINIKLKEVSLEVTNVCNNYCIHCSSNSSPNADTSRELSYIQWRDIIEQSCNLGASVISLSGGDPICYPYWRELVSYIKELGMSCLFYTAGNGMDGFDVEFLSDKATIIYSLEGANPATHDFITGCSGLYRHVLELIAKSVSIGASVEIHFTPMKQNYTEIPDFLNLAEKLGVNKVSFLRLVPQGRCLSHTGLTLLTPAEFLQVQRMLYEYDGNVKYRIGCPLSFGHLLGYINMRPRCHAGEDLLLVRPDGDVHCCAGWKQCEELVLGNVKEQTLKEIWEGSEALELVRKFNREELVTGNCERCKYFAICGGGCPAQRIILNSTVGWRDAKDQLSRGVDPMCPYWNGLINYVLLERIKTQDKEGNIVWTLRGKRSKEE